MDESMEGQRYRNLKLMVELAALNVLKFFIAKLCDAGNDK